MIVERLFSLLQDEAEQLKASRKAAAASPSAGSKPRAPPRPRRTPAQMAEKLQLRSTSEPAQQAKRASAQGPLSGPALVQSQQQLPGARAAQMVRLAMMGKIAKASMVSSQQKQQREAASAAAAAPEAPPQQAKQAETQQARQGPLKQPPQAQQAKHTPTEIAWESATQSSLSSEGAAPQELSVAEPSSEPSSNEAQPDPTSNVVSQVSSW